MERIYSPEISKIDSQTLPAQKKICQKQQKPNAQHFALLLVLLVIQEGLITNTLWPVAIQLYAFFPAEGGHTRSHLTRSLPWWNPATNGKTTAKVNWHWNTRTLVQRCVPNARRCRKSVKLQKVEAGFAEIWFTESYFQPKPTRSAFILVTSLFVAVWVLCCPQICSD